jgi:hypothetical protein
MPLLWVINVTPKNNTKVGRLSDGGVLYFSFFLMGESLKREVLELEKFLVEGSLMGYSAGLGKISGF